MKILSAGIVLICLQLAAFGQLDDNTLTVTSGGPIPGQLDQAVISISVDFEPTAALDDVLQAVQSAGITSADFVDVRANGMQGSSGTIPTNQWAFFVTVSFAKLSNRLTAFAALQQSVGKNPGRRLEFQIQANQASPQSQALAPCPYAAIFADAAMQARTAAAAAGLMLGQIISVTDGTALGSGLIGIGFAQPPSPAPALPAPGALSLINELLTTPRSFPGCVLSVQFRLLH